MIDVTTKTLITKKTGEQLQNILARLHLRKLRHLYTSAEPTYEFLFLGSDIEEDFRYGDPSQCIGVVHLKDPVLIDLTREFFTSYNLNPFLDSPAYHIEVTDMLSVLNKNKWDPTTVSTEINASHQYIANDKLIAFPVASEFVRMKLLASYLKLKYAVLGMSPHHDVKIDVPDVKMAPQHIKLKKEEFKDTALEEFVENDLKYVITPGVEYLQPRQIIQNLTQYNYGIRVWSDDDKSLRVGGYFDCDAFTFLNARLYAYIA